MSVAIFLTWTVSELVPLVFNSISGAPAQDSVLTGDSFKKIFVKVDGVWCYQTVTAIMSRTSIDGHVRWRLPRLRNAVRGLQNLHHRCHRVFCFACFVIIFEIP